MQLQLKLIMSNPCSRVPTSQLADAHCCLISGGKDAPELNAVLLNVVINGTGIAGTSWLFQRDLKARQRDRSSVEREEALARLQVMNDAWYSMFTQDACSC